MAAQPLMTALGGHGVVATLAARYLRISAHRPAGGAARARAARATCAAIGRLRIPLVIVVVANVANVVLELVFVYGLDMGLDGSALGTVIAQLGMGARVRGAAARRAGAQPSAAPRGDGLADEPRRRDPAAHRVAVRVVPRRQRGAARGSAPASLAAHQIAFQLFAFLALVLDAIAIAGQIIVGRALGAGDAAQAARRRAADDRCGRSVVGCVFAVGLLAGIDVDPARCSPTTRWS